MSRGKKILEDIFGEFEDMSELVDAAIDRVDLVGKAANGHRFILAKSEFNNLLPADVVRGFITKANEEQMPKIETVEVVKDDLDANTILADPITPVDGDDTIPGSAAWEAVDAATASKWTAILARAKNALHTLKDREKAEIDNGTEDDDDSVSDLRDACDAIDYAISILAPFAVNELAESDVADSDADILQKSEVAAIVKAGRSLSGANEAALRKAIESIAQVLDSLPTVPEPTMKKTRVEKIVEEAAVVVKADMSGLADAELARVALTGADGDRSAALQEIGLRALTAGVTAPDDDDDDDTTVDDSDTSEEALTTTPDADEVPAPADEVGTPAGAVAKSKKVSGLKKSEKAKTVEKLVKEARDEESAKLGAIIKSLEDRIATLEAPAPSRVLANGALPPAHLMRGQDAGAPQFGDAAMLRKQMDDAPDSVTKAEASEQMRLAALTALSDLRARTR